MVNKRAVIKYTALGLVTTAYAGAIATTLRPGSSEEDRPSVTPKQALLTGGGLLALTWLAGLL